MDKGGNTSITIHDMFKDVITMLVVVALSTGNAWNSLVNTGGQLIKEATTSIGKGWDHIKKESGKHWNNFTQTSGEVIDDVVEKCIGFWTTLTGAPNVIDAGPTVDELDKESGGEISALGFELYTAEVLAKKLEIGSKYDGQKEVHHIVAQTDKKASLIRTKVFDTAKLHINDKSNLMPMKKSLHKITHSTEYYVALNFAFSEEIKNAYLARDNDAVKVFRENVKIKLYRISVILEIIQRCYMISKIYEADRKYSIKLITITDDNELVYLRTNINTSKLIVENISTKKKVYSNWIGYIATYFITDKLITFLEYDGTIKLFDIEKKQVVQMCKPKNIKEDFLEIVDVYINNGLIIYNTTVVYFVNITTNEYKDLNIVPLDVRLFKVIVLQKEKKLVFNYIGGIYKIFDFELNLQCDIIGENQIENSEYGFLLRHTEMLYFNDKYIMNYLEPVSGSFLVSKKGNEFKGIDDNNEELRLLHHFRKSIGNQKYYYGLTYPKRYIYIFDSATDHQLRRLKAETVINDVLINDSIKVVVIVTLYKITAFHYDDILEFTNYNG